MQTELTKAELALIHRVEQRVAVWRYWKWIQLVLGVILMAFGINQGALDRESAPLWGLTPPMGISVLGGALIIHALWDRIAQERRLLLKLYAAAQKPQD